MADESIRITIGAAKTASVDRVFEDIRRKAARIGGDLNKFLNPSKAVRGLERYSAKLREVATQVKSSDNLRLAGVRRQMTEEERLTRERIRNEQRVARERERAERYVHGIRARQTQREHQHEQRLLNQQTRQRERFARMVSYRSSRFLAPEMPMLSMARRGAHAIAQGIGIDLSGASALQSAIKLESAAVALSNAAYNPNSDDPRNRQYVDPKTITSKALDMGSKYNFDPSQVVAGMAMYQKKAGDFAAADDLLERLTRLAAATGSDLEQLYGTAGELANQLKSMPPEERAKNIMDLLQAFAGQGKLGAVELEDLSKYGARVVSTAGLYEGDKVENMKQLGALVQAARAFGGADGAAMATTAVSRLATTLKTNARVQAFKAQGIDVNNDYGQLKNPVQIIKDSLKATRNDPTEFNKLFMNIMGARAAEGLGGLFRDARVAAIKGGASDEVATDAGIAAVDKFLNEMKDAAITEDEIAEKVKRIQETYSAQVNTLNIEFQKIAGEFLQDFLPVLKEITPELKHFAHMLGEVATWIVRNPKTAIAAAIGASIARAGIESVLRIGLEKAIMSGAPVVQSALARLLGSTAVVPVGAAPAGAAAAGGAGAALAGAALFGGAALGVGAAAYAMYDPLKRITDANKAERAANVAASANQGDGSLQARLASLEAGGRVIEQDLSGARSRAAFSGMTGPASDQVARMAELIAEQRKNNAEISQVKSLLAGGINVNVNGQVPGRTTQDGNR